MRIAFTKMHGAGNDFVMLNAFHEPIPLTEELVRRLGHRQFGIGFDQLLVVEPSELEGVDFKYRIFNQDGNEVQMCGNGARCFAVFVRQQGLTQKQRIRCETLAGIIEPEVLQDGRVRVNMGVPRFEPRDLPFETKAANGEHSEHHDKRYDLLAGQDFMRVSIVSMGNPHAVTFVENVETDAVLLQGEALQHHEAFPERVNVGFMQVCERDFARLRVYERGAGETLACGTGACAAAVAGMRSGRLDSPVKIQMRGGLLEIEWDGLVHDEPRPVFLTGPAVEVFHGEIEI